MIQYIHTLCRNTENTPNSALSRTHVCLCPASQVQFFFYLPLSSLFFLLSLQLLNYPLHSTFFSVVSCISLDLSITLYSSYFSRHHRSCLTKNIVSCHFFFFPLSSSLSLLHPGERVQASMRCLCE